MTTNSEKNNLIDLSETQKKQIYLQLEKQRHNTFKTNLKLTPFGDEIKNFEIHNGVWNPVITSARYHAIYLFFNTHLYKNKVAYDVGCGTGIMGVVMSLRGAKKVYISDISEVAVRNAKANSKHLKNCEVFISDLFKSYNAIPKADCVVFNQPFFHGKPAEGDTIAASMLAEHELIERFLYDSRKHLSPEGVIVMPYFDVAGDNGNDPKRFAKKYDYMIKETFSAKSHTGLQQGNIFIYELSRK